jgi:hypothetical protein
VPPRKRSQSIYSQGRGLRADNRPLVSDICGDPLREETLLLRPERAALREREPAYSLEVDLI